MKLYHFTSEQHLKKIKAASLSKCMIPWKFVNDRPKFVRGFQWLTADPEWGQDWARPKLGSTLPFRKDEYRITINVPRPYLERVIKWTNFCAKFDFEGKDFVNFGNKVDHWFVFRGKIPVMWFEAITRNPTPIFIEFHEQEQ